MSPAQADDGLQYDIFVSYAHIDDEAPRSAPEARWVTTLVDWLTSALQIKLGRKARIYLDHRERNENEAITPSILGDLEASRCLAVIMSRSHMRSAWCRSEIERFASASQNRRAKNNVFIVETDRDTREARHPLLRNITQFEFWTKDNTQRLGYPDPKSDAAYSDQVNKLAHDLAAYLEPPPQEVQPPERAAVLLAEVTDDVRRDRERVAVALRDAGFEVVPKVRYSRESESFYIEAVQADLARAKVFVQLLGKYEGETLPGSERTIVAVQAAEAMAARNARQIPVLQWRSRELVIDDEVSETLRELLRGPDVRACGIEELRREIVSILEAAPSQEREVQRPGLLSIYVDVDQIDHSIGVQVCEHLVADESVTALLSPQPSAAQNPRDNRLAYQAPMKQCDGAVLIYGQTSPESLQNRYFQLAKEFAQKRRGVWGALLDAPPPAKPDPSLFSRQLLKLDCRNGVDPSKLAEFVRTLRGADGAAHA